MRAAVICAVISGDPPFSFAWYKDEQLIKDHSSISVKNIDEFTSHLAITRLGPESNGNYTCKVTNSGGTDEKFDVLSMKGKEISTLFLFLDYFNGNIIHL